MKRFAFQLGDRVIVNTSCARSEWVEHTGTVIGYDPMRENDQWIIKPDDRDVRPRHFWVQASSLSLIIDPEMVDHAMDELNKLLNAQ